MILHFLFSFISTVTFGVLTNVPRRSLPASGLIGAMGWLIYIGLKALDFRLGFANFAAALAIGSLSIYFSRKQKIPVLIFIVPSLVPLVPGGPAYLAVRSFVLGAASEGFHYISVVIVTSGAIAGGFMMTSLIEKLLTHQTIKR